MLNLDAIKARLASITPGEWALYNGWGNDDTNMHVERIGNSAGGGLRGSPDIHGTRADLEFVALAPGDIRALLDEVEQCYLALATLADQLRDCSGYAHNLNYKLNTPKHIRQVEWRDCQDGYCASVKSCLAEHETIIKRAELYEREHAKRAGAVPGSEH